MSILERTKPEPLPAIYAEPEYRVSGQRAAWYAEMKRVFQVPWMGVVTMAFSHYPQFFESLWQGFKPMALSKPFVEACARLRAHTENRVLGMNISPIVKRLETIGYAPREMDQIRATIEVFSHGNFPYLLTATAARRLLEGYELASPGDALPFNQRHGPEGAVPLVLLEAHHADQGTRAVYQDIMNTLHLPFVNTDYRALARWPSYFALAWRELKPLVNSDGHARICMEIHQCADELLREHLPNPGALRSAALCAAARRDGRFEEIRQVARLFQWLLPGLVTNVACLRAQLSL